MKDDSNHEMADVCAEQDIHAQALNPSENGQLDPTGTSDNGLDGDHVTKTTDDLSKADIALLFKELSQDGNPEEEIRAYLKLSSAKYNAHHKNLYDPESGLIQPMPAYKACNIQSLNKHLQWAVAKIYGEVSPDRLIKIEPMTPEEFMDRYDDRREGVVVLTLMPPAPTEWTIPKSKRDLTNN